MAGIQWSPGYSVNVAEIDRQHQELFKMINDLNTAMTQGKGRAILGKIIDRMVSYAKMHFSTEETYFSKFGYPDSGKHRSEHAKFIKKIHDFKSQFEANKIGLSIDIMNFLTDWLKEHIRVSDKKYSSFFNQKGLK